MNKSLIKANGFECIQCKKIVLDGHKHDNEEDICDQCKIVNLEKQLAEKEKEIKDVKNSCNYYMERSNDLLVEKTNTANALKQLIKNCGNANCEIKISFVIEQLEKLQYTINVNQIDDGYTDEQVDLCELNEIIEQQIALLKGKVEDCPRWNIEDKKDKYHILYNAIKSKEENK